MRDQIEDYKRHLEDRALDRDAWEDQLVRLHRERRMSESWTCQQCQQLNASYAEACGRCGCPVTGPRPSSKFRIVFDLDVPEGHMGITQEAVATFYAAELVTVARLMLENKLLLPRARLTAHGVRPLTQPVALPAPEAESPEEPSRASSPGLRPVPSEPATD